MDISIYPPDSDASAITGFTIVVDVLRAFSVSYFIHENRPDRYLAADSVERAFGLRDEIAGSILVGERQGVKIPGFDFGNSPTEIVGRDFRGRTVIHTTTCGTRGLVAQPESNDVVVGSFVNAAALVRHIRANSIDRVNIFCTALPEDVFGEEDYLFADYLKTVLTGGSPDFPAIVARLKAGTGRGFREGGFAPYSDFEYCMALNRFDAILSRRSVDRNRGIVELGV